MTKRSLGIIISIIFITVCAGTQASFSEMTNYELEQEIKTLKEQLKERESILDKFDAFEKLSERLSFSGLIEVEAFARDGFDGEDESDIALATVELGLDAQIADWVSGQIVLLWEEDDTEPMDVDVGTITLGNTDKFPFYLTAGKLYVPFGNFESNMIQDPLTLEIGETRESAVQIGFEAAGFYGSVYTFNGDIDEDGKDNEIKCFGANLGYAFENNDLAIDLGFGIINNIADSELLTKALDEAGIDEIDDYVSGLAAHLIFNYGPFMLIGEYVGATDEFEDGELDFKGRGAEPESWNIEFAFTREIMDKETTFALGYQGTDEALGLPEERYLASIGVSIVKNTSLTLEYLHDEDYSKSKGGTNDDANQITLQLAVEF